MKLQVWSAPLVRLNEAGTDGTDRYMYPFVPMLEKVQIGTAPFRGVPAVPSRWNHDESLLKGINQ